MTITRQHKYRPGDDLRIFLNLYELTAEANGWTTDRQKLNNLHNSFRGRLLTWFGSRTFTTWKDLKESLEEKEGVKKRPDVYFLNKIINTKRKRFSSMAKFINKFEELKLERESNYLRESLGSTSTSTTPDPDTPSSSGETHGDTSSGSIHTEVFYVSLFIKNNSPAELRRLLNQRDPATLREAYRISREYEEDDSDASSSDSSDDDSDSEEDYSSEEESSSRSKKKRSKKTVAPKLLPKTLTKGSKKQGIQDTLIMMLEQSQQLLLLQQQQQQQLQKQQTMIP